MYPGENGAGGGVGLEGVSWHPFAPREYLGILCPLDRWVQVCAHGKVFSRPFNLVRALPKSIKFHGKWEATCGESLYVRGAWLYITPVVPPILAPPPPGATQSRIIGIS
jgi:hypothetical protein